MRFRSALFTLAFALSSITLSLAGAAAHAAPTLDGSDPAGFVADEAGRPQIHSITLYGSGLALPTTTGWTIETDVTVWARWSDGGWTRATNTDPWFRRETWGSDQTRVTFIGLDHPGTLVLAVCVGSVANCAFRNVDVRARSTATPRLDAPSGITVSSFTSATGPNDTRRLVYFQASDLNDGDSTCIWLESYGPVSIGRIDPFDVGAGWGYFWMPNMPVGDYRIWITNKGCSGGGWSVNRWISVRLDWTKLPGSGGFGF